MDSVELKDILGWVAVAVTCGVNLCGLFICRDIHKNKNTLGISPLPFLTGFVSNTLWLSYGTTKQDLALCVVNGAGACLQTSYTIYYYYMSISKGDITKKIVIMLSTVFSLIFISNYFSPSQLELENTLGTLCCIGSLIFMSSPLGNIVNVIRARSTESMPFPFIIVTFFMALLWFIYGVLINDLFVQIPNLIGACITALQLSLFVVFPSSSAKSSFVL